MAELNVPITPGSGGPNVDLFQVDNGNVRQVICIGDASIAAKVAPVDAIKGMTVLSYQIPMDKCISITGVAAAAVTATLPAVASQFHYIALIEIVKFFTAANVASATPLVVTTTNVPGALAFTFGQPLGTIGTTDVHLYVPVAPIQSSVAGTSTTIVCPATAGIIWRVNIAYYTAP